MKWYDCTDLALCSDPRESDVASRLTRDCESKMIA